MFFLEISGDLNERHLVLIPFLAISISFSMVFFIPDLYVLIVLGFQSYFPDFSRFLSHLSSLSIPAWCMLQYDCRPSCGAPCSYDLLLSVKITCCSFSMPLVQPSPLSFSSLHISSPLYAYFLISLSGNSPSFFCVSAN